MIEQQSISKRLQDITHYEQRKQIVDVLKDKRKTHPQKNSHDIREGFEYFPLITTEYDNDTIISLCIESNGKYCIRVVQSGTEKFRMISPDKALASVARLSGDTFGDFSQVKLTPHRRLRLKTELRNAEARVFSTISSNS